jgi:uncharacterized damage-inducible protein DinB
MALNKALLMELEHEAKSTRKILERVPFDKATWKPHEKSHTLVALASHVARTAIWVERAITLDELDMGAPNAFPKVELPKNTAELLATFDGMIASGTKHLQDVSDETLMKPWVFRNGATVIFNMPKAAIIRNMGYNHIYHHRGQLSVYLRLLGVPVPGMYGPSADEK